MFLLEQACEMYFTCSICSAVRAAQARPLNGQIIRLTPCFWSKKAVFFLLLINRLLIHDGFPTITGQMEQTLVQLDL